MDRPEQLGLENLEERMNLSAVATLVAAHILGHPSAYVSRAAPVRRITLSTPATKPVSKPVVKPVAKPINSPVVTSPTPTPPSTTPTTTPPVSTTAVVTSASTSSQSIPSLPALAPITAPDPLAGLIAQLHGDDIHDDSAIIQQLVDTAYTQHLSNINLPAGTFLLNRDIHFYGSNVTLSGQGDATILDVNNNYHMESDGTLVGGMGLNIGAQLNATPLMIDQQVTGKTIVFRGNANVKAGQTLFLSNGKGSTALIESARGGKDTGPGAFNEIGPDEYIQIVSVSVDAGGNTVATLAGNIVGVGDYFNVAPAGVSSQNYLHAVAVDKPADHLTVQNLDITFTNKHAQASMYSFYTNHLTVQNVNIINRHNFIAPIWTVGTMNALFQNINNASGMGINSSRLCTVSNCTMDSIGFEECSTDNLITHNKLTGTTTADLRVNDMACERDTFEYNDVHGGVANSGAIAIAEGVDITVSHNTVHDGNAGIWLGYTQRSNILNNVADRFANFEPANAATQIGNSWQK